MPLPSTDEIIDDISFFDDWEERYQYIIDLGKALPGLPTEQCTQDKLVPGCQSQVWLITEDHNGKLHFKVDSDAIIVQGLLALVMAAYDDKTPQEILEFDVDAYFNQLDLERHLSPTRGNGLRAIVARVRKAAQESAR